jgi:hypothetical protein
MTSCQPCGPFAGWSVTDLQAALRSAEQALIDLSTGAKGEVFAYTQGDGSKSVTYTRANIGNLSALIMQLKQALGLCGGRRRPIGFSFR